MLGKKQRLNNFLHKRSMNELRGDDTPFSINEDILKQQAGIKVFDEILCISNLDKRELIVGHVYKVIGISPSTNRLILNELDRQYSRQRFIPYVKKENKKEMEKIITQNPVQVLYKEKTHV
jgi:hypothetical protein